VWLRVVISADHPVLSREFSWLSHAHGCLCCSQNKILVVFTRSFEFWVSLLLVFCLHKVCDFAVSGGLWLQYIELQPSKDGSFFWKSWNSRMDGSDAWMCTSGQRHTFWTISPPPSHTPPPLHQKLAKLSRRDTKLIGHSKHIKHDVKHIKYSHQTPQIQCHQTHQRHQTESSNTPISVCLKIISAAIREWPSNVLRVQKNLNNKKSSSRSRVRWLSAFD